MPQIGNLGKCTPTAAQGLKGASADLQLTRQPTGDSSHKLIRGFHYFLPGPHLPFRHQIITALSAPVYTACRTETPILLMTCIRSLLDCSMVSDWNGELWIASSMLYLCAMKPCVMKYSTSSLTILLRQCNHIHVHTRTHARTPTHKWILRYPQSRGLSV